MLAVSRIRLEKYIDEGIILFIFIYAIASLTSKGLSSIAIGFSCLLWLVKVIIAKNKNIKFTVLGPAAVLFILSLIISRLDQASFNLHNISKYILAVIFYFIIVTTVTELKTIKKLAYTTLVSMIVAIIYGFYEYYVFGIGRMNSFTSSLAFGGYLVIFLMFTITFTIWGQVSKKQKLILGLLTVIMGIGLLLTKTRGAWLAFIGGSITLFWLKDKKLILVFMIFLLILFFILPQSLIDRFESIFDVKINKSNVNRLGLWRSALLMYKDHPINGVGMKEFPKEYQKKEYKTSGVPTYSHTHNNYLQFLSETGTIGFLSYMYLIITILKVIYQGYHNLEGNWKLFILSSLVAMITFHLQGFTQFNFGHTDPLRFFWFLTALDVIIIRKFCIISGENN